MIPSRVWGQIAEQPSRLERRRDELEGGKEERVDQGQSIPLPLKATGKNRAQGIFEIWMEQEDWERKIRAEMGIKKGQGKNQEQDSGGEVRLRWFCGNMQSVVYLKHLVLFCFYAQNILEQNLQIGSCWSCVFFASKALKSGYALL